MVDEMSKSETSREKNRRRFAQRSGRNIVVGGISWEYTVGSGDIVAYSENGERKCEGIHVLKGTDPDSVDRGRWKKTTDGMLRPREVARWLGAEHASA